MERLIDLFKDPEPWIIELENRAWYNSPILGENNQYHYIYCWVNLDTQWCYVGKHTSNNPYNDEGYLGGCGNPHYWSSRRIHQYKCLILSYEDSATSALLLESMVIDDYLVDTYSQKGLFNLIPGGGGNIRNLITPEARKAALKSIANQYNGDTAGQLHTPEVRERAIKSSLETRRKIYGTTFVMNEEQRLRAITNSIKTKIELYDDAGWPLHTKESKEAANKATLENLKKVKDLYGDPMYYAHTESARNSRLLTILINNILKRINYLKSINLEITAENYLLKNYDASMCWNRHIPNVLKVINELKSDPRWTEEMESVFSKYKLNPNKSVYGHDKIILI